MITMQYTEKPAAISTRSATISDAMKLSANRITASMTIPATSFFHPSLMIVSPVRYPLQYLKYSTVITDSAIRDATIAPYPQNLGIRTRLRVRFTSAPMMINFALSFLLPEGV